MVGRFRRRVTPSFSPILYKREVGAASGSVKWTRPDPANGELMWETTALWGEHA